MIEWSRVRADAARAMNAFGRISLRAQDIALCLFRKWWRPLSCGVAVGAVFVNGIYIPIKTHTGADLTGLATVLGALAPFAIARSVELIKGRVDDDAS